MQRELGIEKAPTAPAPGNNEDESVDAAFTYKYNYNQIRSKLRTFLGTKELTLSEFLKEC
ncbi:hypothetical protein GN244_ATG07537 [Phytophthora infestans]|uniref:Uncharacterized protein n=1 Tax=Phytophthora infestans TaxID=4787 RepID=A0A833WFT6_PHYIN|nr:hypothetical protein GN244_ATG07537 [Phytophthora infestans]